MGHGSLVRALSFDVEEELGREGKNAPAGPGVEERAVGGGLAAAQALVERSRAARCADAEGHGEVELIDVAGADELVDGLDALDVFGLG
jgi:hypothetical protein